MTGQSPERDSSSPATKGPQKSTREDKTLSPILPLRILIEKWGFFRKWL